MYVPVIKIHMVGEVNPKLDFEYYYAVEYTNFHITNGKCEYAEGCNVPFNCSFAKEAEFRGKEDHVYSKLIFKGFESLDSLENYYMKGSFSIYETNVEDK